MSATDSIKQLAYPWIYPGVGFLDRCPTASCFIAAT